MRFKFLLLLLLCCGSAFAQNVFCPVGANCTTTGNNIHNGTETFNSTVTANGAVNLNSGVTVTGNIAASGTVTGSNIPATISGTGTCTNQFVRVLNNAAGPTCASVNLASDITGFLSLSNLTSPTGTGFAHVTAGAIDSASKLISLTASSDVAGNQGSTTTVLHGNAAGQPAFSSVTSSDLSITTTSCTNQFVTAISASGVGTCTTDTLASAQHANQGTITTLLHGNAAGNPSFSAVALGTDVSGQLGTTNGGTGQNSSATFPTSGTVNTGTGTTNTISKFTNGASGVHGNSGVTDDGTTVSTSEAVTVTGTLTSTTFICKSLENIKCVDTGNTQGWAGSDVGAWINAAIAALPATGGTVYVAAGNYTATTTIAITNVQDILIMGAGKGATVIASGITGSPANPLVSITSTSTVTPTQEITFQGMEFAGSSGGAIPTNTGNMVFINASGASVPPINNVVFRDCYIGRTKGTGLNQAGGSIPSAAVYAANTNDIGFDNVTLGSSKYGLYMDNVGAITPVVGVWIRNSLIQGMDNDGIFGTAGAQSNVSVMQSDISENTGWALNTTSTIDAFHWFSNYSEFDQAGFLNITAAEGVIQGSRFILAGTANGTALSATEFLKFGTNFTGTITGNRFLQSNAPGTPTAFIRGVFTGASIKGNSFNLSAGTLTNAIVLQAGGAGINIGPNMAPGAGTITAYLNDQITTTTSTDASIPININRSWTVTGGGGGFKQISTNTDVAMFTNGTGAVALNVQSGGGTGGTTFGDGAGNVKAGVDSSGRFRTVEAAAPSGIASNQVVFGDSGDHMLKYNPNNAGEQHVPLRLSFTSNYTNATTTFSTITNMSFPVNASQTYTIDCMIPWQASATTAGPKFQLTGPASPTAVTLMVDGGTGASAFADAVATAFSSAVTAFGTAGATGTNFIVHVHGFIANGTNAGTVALQAAANGAGTLTIIPTDCRVQ